MTIVGVAFTGADALRDYEQLRPDVTFLDFDLGSESGIAVAELLHRTSTAPRPPVILISIHDERELAAVPRRRHGLSAACRRMGRPDHGAGPAGERPPESIAGRWATAAGVRVTRTRRPEATAPGQQMKELGRGAARNVALTLLLSCLSAPNSLCCTGLTHSMDTPRASRDGSDESKSCCPPVSFHRVSWILVIIHEKILHVLYCIVLQLIWMLSGPPLQLSLLNDSVIGSL